ncbi:hypothetical protein Avbf_18844, partial [Armadillidium vulgare]
FQYLSSNNTCTFYGENAFEKIKILYIVTTNIGENEGTKNFKSTKEALSKKEKMTNEDVFSTSRRFAGESHEYPRFSSEEDAYQRVLIIVDHYNDTVNFIKNRDFLDISRKYSLYFICAAWILHKFVSLHPFADGNGRMGRLLASYCLYLVCPFPCPIFNIHNPTTTRNIYLKFGYIG